MNFEKFASLIDSSVKESERKETAEQTSKAVSEEGTNLIFKHLIFNDSLELIDLDAFTLEDCLQAAEIQDTSAHYTYDEDEYDEHIIFDEDHPYSYIFAFFKYDQSMQVIPSVKSGKRKFI